MPKDLSVIALISGRGSNLQSLIQNSKHYTIFKVFCDLPQAKGILIAQEHKIPCEVLDPSKYISRKALKQELYASIEKDSPDLIVLAGFMQILDRFFVEQWYGKIINIHPSLLPAYPGLDTHQRVLEAGEVTHGCTVHFVDVGVDSGPIIAQARCECNKGDSIDTLSDRVLKLEHQLYPWVLNCYAQGLLQLEGRKVICKPQMITEAKERKFILLS